MNRAVELAKATLLEPSALEFQHIHGLFGQLMSHNIDYADIYFQRSRSESWSLEDGSVKSGSRSTDQGVGIRAISGEKTGFAYSDEMQLPELVKAAQAARAIAQAGGDSAGQNIQQQRHSDIALYSVVDPLTSFPDADKVALLRLVESEARRQDPRVRQVMASLAASHEVILIACNDGSLTADVRPLIRLNVHVIAESKGRREQGSAGGGGRFGYEWLDQDAVSYTHLTLPTILLV